ncbi:MAG: DMT family transporter [Rhodobacteraceae bacterium]|nr:DMT family transporter [Paracoccaceae bacterium]
MERNRTTLFATAIVIATGVIWGFYWIPVRALDGMGFPGAWGTFAITMATVAVLTPVALWRRGHILTCSPVALASIALGGAAFAFYSVSFVYGRVAIVILLYFLTPVWSTLIARYLMGWTTPPLRIVAIGVGLAGLATMLAADGELPIPRNTGEWLALWGGLLWSFSTTGIRARSTLGPLESAFVFACGAMPVSFVLALGLAPLPETDDPFAALGLALATGTVWWALSVASLMWAAVRLEPARVGILLMTEVLVGAASAAMLAGETLTRVEIFGGALVLCAGVLEVWPTRRPARQDADH